MVRFFALRESVLLALLAWSQIHIVHAATITLDFTGSVDLVSNRATEADPVLPSLAPVSLGDTVQGTLVVDTTDLMRQDFEVDSGAAVLYRLSAASNSQLTFSLNENSFSTIDQESLTINDNLPNPCCTGSATDRFDFQNNGIAVQTPEGQVNGTLRFILSERYLDGTVPELVQSAELPTNESDFNLANAEARGAIFTDNYSLGVAVDLESLSFSFEGFDDTPEPPSELPFQVARQSLDDVLSIDVNGIDTPLYVNGDGPYFEQYGEWRLLHDFEVVDQNINIFVDLELIGDSEAARQQFRDGLSYVEVWEQGIEDIWSNGATVQFDGVEYSFNFDVNFVEEGGDYTINVIDDIGRSDVFNWYLDEVRWGDRYEDEKAAHEFGHLLGLFDEYAGAENPFAAPGDQCTFTNILGGTGPIKFGNWCNSLMADLGPTQERYYDRILELMGLGDGFDPVIGMAPPGYYAFDVLPFTAEDNTVFDTDVEEVAPVPLPPGAWLLISGFGLLYLRRFIV